MSKPIEEAAVRSFNRLLQRCGIEGSVGGLHECRPAIFTLAIQQLFTLSEDSFAFDADGTPAGEVAQCQAAIDMIAADVMGVDLGHVTATGIAHNDAFTTTCLIELLSEIQKSMLAHSYSTSSSNSSHLGSGYGHTSAAHSSLGPGSRYDYAFAASTHPNGNYGAGAGAGWAGAGAGAAVNEELWTDEPLSNSNNNNSGSSSEETFGGVAYNDELPRSETALEAALDLLEVNRHLPDANRLHPIMHNDLGRPPHPLLDSSTTTVTSGSNGGGGSGGSGGSSSTSEAYNYEAAIAAGYGTDSTAEGVLRPDLQAQQDLSSEIQALINRYTNDVKGLHNDGGTTATSDSDLEELFAFASAAADRVHVGGGARIGPGHAARTSPHAVDGRVSVPTVELLDAHNRAWNEKARHSPDPTVQFLLDPDGQQQQEQQSATGVVANERTAVAAAAAANIADAPLLRNRIRLAAGGEQGPRSDTSLSHPDSLGGSDGYEDTGPDAGASAVAAAAAAAVNADLARSHSSLGKNQRREDILKAVLRGATTTAAAASASRGAGTAYHGDGSSGTGTSQKEKKKKKKKKTTAKQIRGNKAASVAGANRKPSNKSFVTAARSDNHNPNYNHTTNPANTNRGSSKSSSRRQHSPPPAGAHVGPPKVKSRKQARAAAGIKHPGPQAGLTVPNIEAVLPGLPVSQHVKRHLWSTHMKRAEAALRNSAADAKRPPLSPALLAEEMEKKQVARITRAKDDAARKKRVEAEAESKDRALKVRRAVYEQRRSSAQLNQFYQQYHRKQQSQQIRRRTGEELAVRRLFNQYTKEAMDRTREAEKYAKEMQAAEDRRREDEIISCARWFEDQVELFEASRRDAHTDTKALETVKERSFEKLKADMQAQITNVQGHILDELNYSSQARLADVDFARSAK